MTNEQVKDILRKAFEVYINSLYSDDEYFTIKQLEVLEANKIIGEALKKQTPMKPVETPFRLLCPNCGQQLSVVAYSHCMHCGQAIDIEGLCEEIEERKFVWKPKGDKQ